MRVENPVYTHPLVLEWVRSAEAQGLASNDEFNGVSQMGTGLYQSTIRDGRRWSAADAYLRPALSRPNLTVRAPAFTGHARRPGEGACCGRGLPWRHGRRGHRARAGRSRAVERVHQLPPQLVTLSGIGPAAHLQEHGIDVLVDLQGVGSKLQDHPAVPHIVYVDAPTVPELVTDPSALKLFQDKRRGPFASAFAEAGGLLSTTADADIPEDADIPDVQFMAGQRFSGKACRP
nr:GMC family oxidoreductase N-terminal domain-containing protein [Streptomyces aurantiacus]